MANYPVTHDANLRRIAALPRRKWTKENALALAESWSPQLHNDYGRQVWDSFAVLDHGVREKRLKEFARDVAPLRMSWGQAMLCFDFVTVGGVVGAAPVGIGKTLALYLMALLAELHWDAKRAVAALPAGGVKDAIDAWQRFVKVWKAPSGGVAIVNYKELASAKNECRLCDCKRCLNGAERPPNLNPSLYPNPFLLDESDYTRNRDSVAAQRCNRYWHQHRHERHSACMTGTLVRKSPDNFFPHLIGCLGDSKAPCPLDWTTQQEWIQALSDNPREGFRDPGAILKVLDPSGKYAQLAAGDDDDRRSAARLAYGDWLADTPGVVIIGESSCDQPITIRVIEAPRDPLIEEAFEVYNRTDVTPDGWRIADVFADLQFQQQLGCGFYMKPNPRPPPDWLKARNDYSALVRQELRNSKHRKRPLDSEAQVRHLLVNTDEYKAWKAIEDSFTWDSQPVAVSTSVIRFVAEWMRTHGPALVYAGNTWTGEMLARYAKCQYITTEGTDKHGRPPTPGYNAVVALHSNRRIRNWQAWSTEFVIGCEHSEERHEQRLGRIHRFGQESPVESWHLLTCGEDYRALEKAATTAHQVRELSKLPQKLLDATWDLRGVQFASNWRKITDVNLRARWQH